MSRKRAISRCLLAIAATIYLVGAAVHARAFIASASRIIDGSAVKAFFASELKVLWLADSATLLGLALFFGLMAAKPQWAARPVILALAWIPGATTALLYIFLGPFYAAHMLLLATAMILLAAWVLPAQDSSVQAGRI